jgi:hypothetical protein
MQLPDDVSIQITKKGKSPANIRVVQGDKSWEVTEDDLAKLPEKLRPFVEGMIGRGGAPWEGRLRVWAEPQGDVLKLAPGKQGDKPKVRKLPPGFGGGGPDMSSLDQRLDEVNRQLKELRNELDKLRQSHEDKGPSKETGKVEEKLDKQDKSQPLGLPQEKTDL